MYQLSLESFSLPQSVYQFLKHFLKFWIIILLHAFITFSLSLMILYQLLTNQRNH